MTVNWLLFDLRRNLERFAIANDFQLDVFIQFDLRHQASQRVNIFYVVAIKLADHIAFLHFRLRCRRPWDNFVDGDAFALCPALIGLERARQNSKIAANDPTVLQQALESGPHGV